MLCALHPGCSLLAFPLLCNSCSALSLEHDCLPHSTAPWSQSSPGIPTFSLVHTASSTWHVFTLPALFGSSVSQPSFMAGLQNHFLLRGLLGSFPPKTSSFLTLHLNSTYFFVPFQEDTYIFAHMPLNFGC